MNRRRERKDMAFGSILPTTGRKITVHLGGACVSGVNGVFFWFSQTSCGFVSESSERTAWWDTTTKRSK